MSEQWVITAKRADFNGIAAEFGIDPVVARCIRNRDVEGSEAIRQYLSGGPESLHAPELFRDMETAGDNLLEAIEAGVKIRVVGDYDIDGVTSSHILLSGLSRLGAVVDARIPERIKDGYGLSEKHVREAAEDGAELLLTCDNGIAAADAIALAGELGLTVIVTDHHEVPFEEENGVRREILPPADAILDAKREGETYPFAGLCGAGVAWKLISYLFARSGLPKDAAEELLEFVAIATIGDVMELRGENRILVKEGLKRLRKTKNPGLTELILQNGLELSQVDTYHVGFILGPCLNASGRLDTAERALRLFGTKDRDEAARIATELIDLNVSRKTLTEQGKAEAIAAVETSDLKNDRVLVVFLPEVHESLAGIIAGRLREHFHKPAFVLTRSEAEGEEGLVKGSGRSIEDYDMFAEMHVCADLFLRYGGHKMAAGLSLSEENIDAFRRRINENCKLTEEQLQGKIRIDVAMPISYVTKDLVEQLELMRPFGHGNTRPVFAQKDLRAEDVRIFGKNRNVAKFRLVGDDGIGVPAVYFGDAEGFAAYAAAHPLIAVVYYPAIDNFRGASTLQITVTAYK